jgi:hypothetical protein
MGDSKASGDRKEPTSRNKRQGAQRGSPKPEQNPGSHSPTSVRNGGVQAHQNGGHHGNEGQSKWRRFFSNVKLAEWIMISFTAITAMATWAGVYVQREQTRLGSEQIALSARQLDRSLTGIVSVEPIPQVANYSVGGEPMTFLTVENVGPISVKARLYIRTEIVGRDDPPRRNWSDYKNDPTYGRATIAPGKSKSSAVKWDKLDAKTLAALMKDQRELQVTAVVEFTDGTDKTQTEPFCARWYGPPGKFAEYCPTE